MLSWAYTFICNVVPWLQCMLSKITFSISVEKNEQCSGTEIINHALKSHHSGKIIVCLLSAGYSTTDFDIDDITSENWDWYGNTQPDKCHVHIKRSFVIAIFWDSEMLITSHRDFSIFSTIEGISLTLLIGYLGMKGHSLFQ